jgi:hypothetical protein
MSLAPANTGERRAIAEPAPLGASFHEARESRRGTRAHVPRSNRERFRRWRSGERPMQEILGNKLPLPKSKRASWAISISARLPREERAGCVFLSIVVPFLGGR